MPSEEENARRLQEEIANHPAQSPEKTPEEKDRSEKNKPPRPKASPKNLAENVLSAASLIGSMEPRDIFFAVTIMMAFFKDLADMSIVAALLSPLVLIMTIAAMLVCGDSHYFGKKKAATVLVSSLVETIPGFNLLPAGTFSTILIYVFILQERKDKKQSSSSADEDGNTGDE